MKPEMKKLIIANLPYLLFVYLFGKLGQTYRLAAGADLSEKLLHLADGFSLAFESAAPSFHLFDLAVGVAGAVALRLMVYCKSKNAKKYRRGVEYGSVRWGSPKDIPMCGAAAPQAPALIVPASLAGLSIIPAGMWDARRRRGFTTSALPFPRSRPSPATLYFSSALMTLPGCPMWGCMWEIRSCCTAETPFPTQTSIQATGSSIFIVTGGCLKRQKGVNHYGNEQIGAH